MIDGGGGTLNKLHLVPLLPHNPHNPPLEVSPLRTRFTYFPGHGGLGGEIREMATTAGRRRRPESTNYITNYMRYDDHGFNDLQAEG